MTLNAVSGFSRMARHACRVIALPSAAVRGWLARRRPEASPRPVLRRLMVPLSSVLLLLVAGFGALMVVQRDRALNQASLWVFKDAIGEFSQVLAAESRALSALQDVLVREPVLREALGHRDRQRLLDVYAPFLAALRESAGVARLHFMDPERVCILRVDAPEDHGDRIDRVTVREAERTGQTASGIELGPQGTLTLRVVRPVHDGESRSGYVDIGKEIGGVLDGIRTSTRTELAVVLRKGMVDREAWEAAARRLGREADWDRFTGVVLGHSTLHGFPLEADHGIGVEGFLRGGAAAEVVFDDAVWQVRTEPLHDASGLEIGRLLVMHDTSEMRTAQQRLMAVAVGGGGLLTLGLCTFLFMLLRRTDAGIRAQQSVLRANEERQSATLRSIGDGVIVCDAHQAVVSLNPVAERLTGWFTAEAAGRPLEEVVHLIDARTREKAENPVDRVQREGPGAKADHDTTLLARDGTACLVNESCAIIRGADGRSMGAVLVIRDVTEACRRRDELAVEKQRIEYILGITNTGLNISDAHFNLHYVDPAWQKTYGNPTGRKCHDYFMGRDRPCEGCGIPRALETKDVVIYEEVLPREGNRVIEVHTIPFRDAAGEWMVAEFNVDITDRKRAEETLRSSEARLRSITESAQDAIIMMDSQGIISFWNPAAETILGYRADEALGADLHALLAPERYLPAYRAAFPEFARSGSGAAIGKTLELAARRKDGCEIDVALSLSRVCLEGQWHAVGILHDITERKRAEVALETLNGELEEQTRLATEMAARAEMASAAKSEFLANMSHEIRTPMNGVIGMTGLLLDTDLSEEQRRYAEIVRASGESLLGIINDILDFSKIEAGKLDLEILGFDLATLLDDLAATLALRAQDKGLELLCGADPNVPTLLRGDPGRLRQILTNLVCNAVKFTHEGEVAIRVAVASRDGGTVLLRFAVRDTGIGIPEDKIGLLFDKFTQADASTTRRYGGTGLGLAICKQLAGLLGGRIGVTSACGNGSEFWFTARFEIQTDGRRADAPVRGDLRDVRVLIVDDNATNREILTARLGAWGMRTAEAKDGPGALQALYRALEQNDPFRLAVIDRHMPGMDGVSLGRAIQADVRLARVRMVMLTSVGIRGDARQFEDLGFAGYLTKPVRQDELQGVLALALAERPGGDAAVRPIATRHAVQESVPRFDGRKVRILLAEDNITNQQVALGLLKKMGLAADAVANGKEVLEALASIPYDVVLMDCQMPVMDGYTATREIRSRRSAVRDPDVPVIAMTAHAMQGDRDRCLEAGMNDYLPKPVAPRTLADMLERWLPKNPVEGGTTEETPAAGPGPDTC